MTPLGKNVLRVYDRHGVAHVRTFGTKNPKERKQIADFVRRMREYRRWPVLDAIVARELTCAEAWDADRDGTLGDVLARLASRRAEREAAERDPDLSPLVAEWDGRGRRTKWDVYVKQVRKFIPADERFPRSRFRRGEIKKFLDTLPFDRPTKNRYRVALSQFARWLVEREYLETNPVRDVSGYGENDPRMVFLTRPQAKALVNALDGEPKLVAALMAGTGVEWQAVQRATRRDFDLEKRTFRAHGSKTKWRNRTVRVTEAWVWPLLEAHLRLLTDGAPFVTATKDACLDAQAAACVALKLPHHVLHDWRHTYAIYSLEARMRPQSVKRQLGHSPHSTVLERVYAAWIPEPEEQASDVESDTQAVTPPRRRARR